MSKAVVLQCFLLFLALGGFHKVNADKLNVTIYYETLCGDSKKFFVQQFNRTYFSSDEIQKNINPVLLPFGHGNKTGDVYTCQHGPLECSGNKLQACAIRLITDMPQQVRYVSCIMNNTLTSNSTETTFPSTMCKDEAGAVYDKITECHNSPKWDDLDKVYNVTMNFWGNNTVGVPYISFNNVRDDSLSEAASKNFTASLCSKLSSLKLQACGWSSASTITGTLIPSIILLVLTKLM